MNFRFVQYGIVHHTLLKSQPSWLRSQDIWIKINIEDLPNYSLHTEYSYGKRNLSSSLVTQFPVLCDANKDGVPQLWKSTEWTEQFAGFVIKLTEGHAAPKVVEIHPPFNDYCDIEQFLERYAVFEKTIHAKYPDAEIVVENRAGAVYHGGRFIVSSEYP